MKLQREAGGGISSACLPPAFTRFSASTYHPTHPPLPPLLTSTYPRRRQSATTRDCQASMPGMLRLKRSCTQGVGGYVGGSQHSWKGRTGGRACWLLDGALLQ